MEPTPLTHARNALEHLDSAIDETYLAFMHQPDLKMYPPMVRAYLDYRNYLLRLIDDLENPGTREEDQ